MERNLLLGFEIELATINERLAAGRARLATIEDREEAAVAQLEVVCLEKLFADIEAARTAAFLAECRATETVEKFRKWRGFVLECQPQTLAELVRRGIESVDSVLRLIAVSDADEKILRTNFDGLTVNRTLSYRRAIRQEFEKLLAGRHAKRARPRRRRRRRLEVEAALRVA